MEDEKNDVAPEHAGQRLGQPYRGAQPGDSMITKTAAHTPGPWTAGTLIQNDGGIAVLTTTRDRIAKAWAGQDGGSAAANATLIAAAPELLAALRALVRAWDHQQLPVIGGLEEALHDADAAIAKAEQR